MSHPFEVAAQVTRTVPTTIHDDPEVDGEDAIEIVAEELQKLVKALDDGSSDIIDVTGLGTGQVTVVCKVWFDYLGTTYEDGYAEAEEALKAALPNYTVTWFDAETDGIALVDMIYAEACERWERQDLERELGFI